MKVLHLTLKKKWFDMIASGEKNEEYREVKPYWITRLLHYAWEPGCTPFIFYDMEIAYDAVLFRNGYSPTSPAIFVEYLGVKIGNTKDGWADKYQTEVFVIKLGRFLTPNGELK